MPAEGNTRRLAVGGCRLAGEGVVLAVCRTFCAESWSAATASRRSGLRQRRAAAGGRRLAPPESAATRHCHDGVAATLPSSLPGVLPPLPPTDPPCAALR